MPTFKIQLLNGLGIGPLGFNEFLMEDVSGGARAILVGRIKSKTGLVVGADGTVTADTKPAPLRLGSDVGRSLLQKTNFKPDSDTDTNITVEFVESTGGRRRRKTRKSTRRRRMTRRR